MPKPRGKRRKKCKPESTKFWCFTINNPTDDDDKQLADLVDGVSSNPRTVSYLTWGNEKGDAGTPHYQGYVELMSPQRLSYLKKRLSRAHLEQRAGSAAQARDYCHKEGQFVEHGEFRDTSQGKREDLHAIRNAIMSGRSMEEIEYVFFDDFARYHRYFHDFANRMRCKPRDYYPKVVVHWGESGKGKTRAAFEASESSGIVSYRNSFFQGYTNQDVVIFDEVDNPISYFGRSLFLQLCDRYPMRVNIKGGDREWNPKEIHFTTNKDPRSWIYSDPAIKRRVHEIKQY